MSTPHTFSLLAENRPAVLVRLASIFGRRGAVIDALTASPCEIAGTQRWTILTSITPARAEQIRRQLEKQVEVLEALVRTTQE